jgi:hypothetical protein
MPNSPLDFGSSEGFRKKLTARNLTSYGKSPYKPNPPLNYEYVQSDSGVIDSPDNLIDEPIFAKNLYKNNRYGAEGGYKPVPDTSGLLNTKSNDGEYGFQDAKILDQGISESKNWKKINPFGNNSEAVLDGAEFIGSLNTVDSNGRIRYYDNQPYFTFVPSTYGPVNILLNPDPQGDNGLLSQDSYLAKIGAEFLRKDFERRIASQIVLNTSARINVFNANSGTDILNMVTGVVPLIEPNYQITVPQNPVLAATDFALRLAGSYIAASTIPGSYFDPSINSGQPTTIQQLRNAFRRSNVGKFFSQLGGSPKTGSQLFINNTGSGQKSRLFANLNYNKFKPGYDRNIFDRLLGKIVGDTTNNSNYYVGSVTSEPSRVFSPSGDIPVDAFGNEVQAPVYGPQELSQMYEGTDQSIRLGANGPAYSNGGGIEGGFTWVSPKYKGNAGKKVGIGGGVTDQDEDFKPSSYNSTESTNYEFREGSILDDTQRIIDSQPQGGRRLKHVGNAIDQVSKVFNDGYKELTKGSRVIRYEGAPGQEVGTEYCRVFNKDVPYLQYNDLQKSQGITTQNRKISYSILDSTYNLNIAPNKREGGQDSTNLIGGQGNGYAKKYMFSIENLAWRTSNKPGYTVADLPVCERGPNGGRVMWFPPYDLKFNDNSTATWRDSNFIGRPEPVYTYSHTSRSGTISWKIVVDHPSVLNVIVNKILENETNKTRVNSIIESFFAGCRTYDIYELAKKYATVSPNDLVEIQEALDTKTVSREVRNYIQNTLNTGVSSTGKQPTQANQGTIDLVSKIQAGLPGLAFYFDNDIPGSSNDDYKKAYKLYESKQTVYTNLAPKTNSNPEQVSNFFPDVLNYNFDSINQLLTDVYNAFKSNQISGFNLGLVATASAPQTVPYNIELSKRRADSITNYIKTFKPKEEDNLTLEQVSNGKLVINEPSILGEESSVTMRYKFGGKDSLPYTCSDVTKDSLAKSDEVYTINAMACRRVAIKDVKVTPASQPPQTVNQTNTFTEQISTVNETITEPIEVREPVKNLSKKVLRMLFSECDYFQAIKEYTPMVYDNLKDKLKFFDPAFHSMTPEGLNSRLVFLNQCLRPGDTIPVVNKDKNGKSSLQYNNAVNTAFGSPPVLILRVGDFYHTRIIPNNLTLTYEGLDLNPEGIGVQPMIANVTLSFNFVGGHGIKEAVDKIQNALSFNYYANTEIYDDRADATDIDSLSKIDDDFTSFFLNEKPPTVNQVQNNDGQNNSGSIGNILTTTETENGQFGDMSYTKFMGGLVTSTENYFNNVINKNKEVLAQYNEGIRQIWSLNRYYTDGFVINTSSPSFIFGKPSTYQKNIDKIFDGMEKNINNDTDDFIVFMSSGGRNFSDRVIRNIKSNYKNFIQQKRSTFANPLTTIIQNFVLEQQNYVMSLAKLNTITYGTTGVSGTDGYQQANGFIRYFYTSGATNTVIETISSDGLIVGTDLSNFDALTKTKTSFGNGYSGTLVYTNTASNNDNTPMGIKYFIPISKDSKFENNSFQLEYIILNQDIINDKKYESFKNDIIGSILNNPKLFGKENMELEKEFDYYWKVIAKPLFSSENTLSNEFISTLEKTQLKNYVNYTPFDKNKERNIGYSNISNTTQDSLTEGRKKLISSLGKTNNTTKNTQTFNDLIDGLLITKVKFN